MNKLIKEIEKLKNSNVRRLIYNRIREFEEIGRSSKETIFNELCFCILTANFNAKKSTEIQKMLEKDFLILPLEKLSKKLKNLGHRYPNKRAEYIVDARKNLKKLIEILYNKNKSDIEKREWIIKNIKGLGYKEASHFLRNIGYKNLAIIDFHILDLLSRYNLIEKPKTLSKKEYLKIENLLKKLARKLKLSLAKLDLYLWYLETGDILK